MKGIKSVVNKLINEFKGKGIISGNTYDEGRPIAVNSNVPVALVLIVLIRSLALFGIFFFF